jgi:hypothetical protein
MALGTNRFLKANEVKTERRKNGETFAPELTYLHTTGIDTIPRIA